MFRTAPLCNTQHYEEIFYILPCGSICFMRVRVRIRTGEKGPDQAGLGKILSLRETQRRGSRFGYSPRCCIYGQLYHPELGKVSPRFL